MSLSKSASPAIRGWQFWIDRGGTFTDLVALTPDQQWMSEKLLSVHPGQYEDAATEGIFRMTRRFGAYTQAPIEVIRIGTTLGTNALLENKGVATALVVNQGFGDLLTIGDQSRPDLFARRIQPRKNLQQCVIEVQGRLDADGIEIEPLDPPTAEEALNRAREKGIESIAIALIHAWRNPAHELTLGALATHLGFREVVLSHQVSSAAKLGVRAATAVLDAYLTPILKAYLENLKADIQHRFGYTPAIQCMQSNGGLIEDAGFRGRDSILSGPAGGLSGAITIARQAGFEKVITFDMGGTSTDVAHFAGQLERQHEHTLRGIRFTAPGLRIHTVAAGGGSILAFDGARLRVGPESAGADPGPLCYRRGGPLTVTDANLLLGRIQARFFPSTFGKNGHEPLDHAAVGRAFEGLATEVHQHTGTRKSAWQLAEDALEIAVEHMALAIQAVSIQRGFDLREDYTLVAFGGAGGQHACRIAERLGIPRILIHPLAGMLSALGIGLSDRRRILERTILEPLSAQVLETLEREVETLIHEERAATACPSPSDRDYRPEVAIRYQGSDHTLNLDLHPCETLAARFGALHERTFGFQRRAETPIIERLLVEEVEAGARHHGVVEAQAAGQDRPPQKRMADVYLGGRFMAIPVLDREHMPIETPLSGPALILDPGSTLVLEPNWSVQKRRDGSLILTPTDSKALRDLTAQPSSDLDPVRLELFNRRFMSIAEEMGYVLQRTAHSVNIRERLDFSCALFDAHGDLIANAPHIPVHLGSMGESVKSLLLSRAADLENGDAWLINSPFEGGTHLPDITVISPYLAADQTPLFFVASRGHHADVGGLSPGSMPPWSRTIEEEGVLSRGLRVLRHGKFHEEAVRAWLGSGPYPSRNPDQNVKDLIAQIAANQRGLEGLQALIERHGLQAVRAAMDQVQAQAARAIRHRLGSLKAGAMQVPLDSGALIQVRVEPDPDRQILTIDFTGSASQQDDNLNAPRAVTQSAVLYVLRLILDEDIPLNAGCLAPVRLIIPEGSLLNPRSPAAVVAGNVETSQHIVDALLGALGLMAASQGTMNNLTFGTDSHQYYETIAGGGGAGPDGAGASGFQTHMTNSRITDPEVLESRFKVRLEHFSLRTGSGGSGRYSGGDGLVRRIRFLSPMSVCLLATRRNTRPFGLAGGLPGLPGQDRLIRQGTRYALEGRVAFEANAGDVLEIQTPGGGGFGPPLSESE